MALPILLNLKIVQKQSENVIFVALSNFALADSGFMAELEYDDQQKYPWGVTIKQVKGGEYSLFANLTREKLQEFSSALSTLLNGFFGLDTLNNPIAIQPKDIDRLHNQVYTYNQVPNQKNITLVPVCDQATLTNKLKSIDFFKSPPDHTRGKDPVPAAPAPGAANE
jgi:hypothetical protein